MRAEPQGQPDAGISLKAGSDLAGTALVPSFTAERLNWAGPLQQGCIEADPFVMWVAVTFVTIVTILFFFLRGVKRPTSRERDKE